jgi:hypothetical protein
MFPSTTPPADVYAPFRLYTNTPGTSDTAGPAPQTGFTNPSIPCFFRLEDGRIGLELHTTNPQIVTNRWEGGALYLVYSDTFLPVLSTLPAKPTFRTLRESTDGATKYFGVKCEEITKNHMGRPFCFLYTIGGLIITTNAFHVRTKRTLAGHKRTRVAGTRDTAYKRLAQTVLSRLEWSLGGYVPNGDGPMVPLFVCTLCSGTLHQGHTTGCPLPVLLA